MHCRSHTRSPGVSIRRVNGRELPLSAIPLCQLLPCHLGPHRPMLSINPYVTGCPGASTCPYQRSLLSFRMRSRSSVLSCASSSLDVMVTMSCCLTLQICQIIAQSFRCRCWRFGFVNGQVSLAWSIALPTQVIIRSNVMYAINSNKSLDQYQETFSKSSRFKIAINLYHSLSKFNRWKIDDDFSNFSTKNRI